MSERSMWSPSNLRPGRYVQYRQAQVAAGPKHGLARVKPVSLHVHGKHACYSTFCFFPPVAALQAPRINCATPSTPSLCRTLVKSMGPPSRIRLPSRFMTSSDAPT